MHINKICFEDQVHLTKFLLTRFVYWMYGWIHTTKHYIKSEQLQQLSTFKVKVFPVGCRLMFIPCRQGQELLTWSTLCFCENFFIRTWGYKKLTIFILWAFYSLMFLKEHVNSKPKTEERRRTLILDTAQNHAKYLVSWLMSAQHRRYLCACTALFYISFLPARAAAT